MAKTVILVQLFIGAPTTIRTIGVATTWEAAKDLCQSSPGVPEIDWDNDSSYWGRLESGPMNLHGDEYRFVLTLHNLTTEPKARQLLKSKEKHNARQS